MSYEVYKVLHLLGILALFCALGGAIVLAFTDTADEQPRARKLLMILHGTALVVVLIAGFGLMARKGMAHGTGWPSWIYGKFAVWLVLGASAAFVRRSGRRALSWIFVLPLIGALAAWLAVVQPG